MARGSLREHGDRLAPPERPARGERVSRTVEPAQLRAVCDPAALRFHTTAELAPLDAMIGQERALAATAFGIGMRPPGYNLFVLGPRRSGKTTTMRRMLDRIAPAAPTPPDWCYVHNFGDPDRPIALELPAGRGRELQAETSRLVAECRASLPRAFESEQFEQHKAHILEDLERRQKEAMKQLEEKARAEGFAVMRTPQGMALAAAPHGEPMDPEEFARLPAAAQEKIEARGKAMGATMEATVREMRRIERDARAAHERLVGDIAAATIRELVQELRERFAGLAGVQRHLDELERDMIAHAEEFRHLEDRPALPFLPAPGGFLDRYRVNVIVDRSEGRGAPVVVEQNPTYGNLLGRVEHHAHFGALVTHFGLIKAGALHRANGGYLILEADDVLRNFQAWQALKKCLKSGAVRIEDPLEEFRFVSTATLAPEPIPLAVKVVLIGSPLLYYLLCALDEDFGELFKVKVDFEDSLPRTPEFEELYARFVAAACHDDALPPFASDAVAQLIEHGARLVPHQARITSRLGELLDVVREAAFYAQQAGRATVHADDVRQAIAQKRQRAALVDDHVRRLIMENTLLIGTDGEAIGQVNGIAVMVLGDHVFGRPSRITARTYTGKPGVIDVEREAKLGGPTHSKGVMIVSGFLAGRYARERPLALAASIAFEQHYDEIDGDSASSAELYALLSSIAGIPLAQGLAVTGSVNQQGDIQAVGGINEKIEGFFDVCQARELTGRQGVLIPEANVRHLMLREDVVAAVRDGRFSIHAVSTVDEGLSLLSGREAGTAGPDGRFPAGTFNAAVEAALEASAQRLRELQQ
jgi:lon-related putative ATP-dependent protease